ncbi:hypothetical protein HMPREF9134_00109 [Porphyromonas catoniae F0037]|uniref:Uncharacterized protein n=1 Tax=Porphyromonas catoniae F0037 TaxID=1127696 RepID=L1NIX1_9PORP|nr:hypothetical protein HMPREF9134_00109 [Porphyromonas catoniae F0037]
MSWGYRPYNQGWGSGHGCIAHWGDVKPLLRAYVWVFHVPLFNI